MCILQRTHTVRDQRDACFAVFFSVLHLSPFLSIFSFLPSLLLFTFPLIFPPFSLLSPTFFSSHIPPSYLTSLPLSYFLSPYPPSLCTSISPYLNPPTSLLPSMLHPLQPTSYLPFLSLSQWPVCECNGQSVAPGALCLQHLPQAAKQHHLCV